MNIAQALRDALAALEAIGPRGTLRGDASIADFYPAGFALDAAREALAAHDAAVSAGGWRVGRGSRIERSDGRIVADMTFRADHRGGEAALRADAARIVACVNACTGIADPAALVQAARDAVDWIGDYVPDDVGGREFTLADLRRALEGAA